MSNASVPEFTQAQIEKALKQTEQSLNASIPLVLASRDIKWDAHDRQGLDYTLAATGTLILKRQTAIKEGSALSEQFLETLEPVNAICAAIRATENDDETPNSHKRFYRDGFTVFAQELGIHSQVCARLKELEAAAVRL